MLRPTYSYRISRPFYQQPQYSPLAQLCSGFNQLLCELRNETQGQARFEIQVMPYEVPCQCKCALHVDSAVSRADDGWKVHGDLPGLAQSNISIVATDAYTVNACSSFQQQVEGNAMAEQEQLATDTKRNNEQRPSTMLHELESEAAANTDTSDTCTVTSESDSRSHKSYQATVEDDLEDLSY